MFLRQWPIGNGWGIFYSSVIDHYVIGGNPVPIGDGQASLREYFFYLLQCVRQAYRANNNPYKQSSVSSPII
jgi:hypothetical protein